MEVARLALDYLNAFLTPAPLAAGIVLFPRQVSPRAAEAVAKALELPDP
jgi:hypothetical protein